MVSPTNKKIDWDGISFKAVFNMIYDDQLDKAYTKLNEWSKYQVRDDNNYTQDTEIKDERIFNLMKLINYCQKEEIIKKSSQIEPGEDAYRFWQKEWTLFEEFIKQHQLYYEENYLGFKHYFYQKIINSLILEFNSQSYYTPIMLDTCKKLLEIGSLEKAEEGFNYIKKKSNKPSPEVDILLVESSYRNEKKEYSMRLLKDLLFKYTSTNLRSLPIPEIKEVIHELALEGYKKHEIDLWLPVFLRLKNILPAFYTLDLDEYKNTIIKINELEKDSFENEHIHQAKLVYSYMYIMDQLKTRIMKGKEYLTKDLLMYIKKLQDVNPFFYQKVKNFYESK